LVLTLMKKESITHISQVILNRKPLLPSFFSFAFLNAQEVNYIKAPYPNYLNMPHYLIIRY